MRKSPGKARSLKFNDGNLVMVVSRSVEILEKLVAFPTISADSNLDLIDWVDDFLSMKGIDTQRIESEDRKKANLYATIGPRNLPGVMLSGHSDVVPVAGQDWTSDPFMLRRSDGRLYGRGSVDMKGFIACCLAMVERVEPESLKIPIHLAVSYDEEVGCLGIRRMIDVINGMSVKPRFCIVGEPTSMQIVTAHKGKYSFRVTCTGQECHSSLAPLGRNAIHSAIDVIQCLKEHQTKIQQTWTRDGDYDVPYTTIHVGVIQGGTALNIVPNHCELLFEIRYLPGDPLADLRTKIRDDLSEISRLYESDITMEQLSGYSGLATPPDSDVVAFMRAVTGGNSLGKISFGTEAGLISSDLGVPSIVCGPGTIERAHKPDEFITEAEMRDCDQMLDRMISMLQ